MFVACYLVDPELVATCIHAYLVISAIDDIINQIKGGQFTLKRTNVSTKIVKFMAEVKTPTELSEMISIESFFQLCNNFE